MGKKSLLEHLIDFLPYSSRIRELAFGITDLSLSEVQDLLVQLGYLAGEYQPGQLDELTRRALRLYQRFHNLALTGTITIETIKELLSPRCGNKDLIEPFLTASDLAESDLVTPRSLLADLRRGCAYRNVTTLTYHIANTPERGGLTSADVSRAIDSAFETWGREIPINFEPVQTADSATLKLKWERGDHSDGMRFNNSITLYGHAFYPPDCREQLPGHCHFNDHLFWGLEDDRSRLVFDLETVALHEIGHLLGLKHSSDLESIMIDGYKGERREVKGDALESIRRLYPRTPS